MKKNESHVYAPDLIHIKKKKQWRWYEILKYIQKPVQLPSTINTLREKENDNGCFDVT